MEVSGAGSSAVSRWKKQYIEELNGQTPQHKKALTPPEQQKTQSLEQQLLRARRDNEILFMPFRVKKPPPPFFVRDNSNLA